MTAPGLRIGSRRSRLALAQAAIARSALETAGVAVAEIVEIATQGDAISEARPHGGWESTDGQFTAELERALLDKRIDVAVHSLKDLPTLSDPRLRVAAVLVRADARDCLLTATHDGLDALPVNATVATSSPRRAAQLTSLRPDLRPQPIRGNVDTRLRRLRNGEVDALVLAAAGLDRLGVEVADAERLPFEAMLPAPGQGALALQARGDDAVTTAALASVDDAATRVAVDAERALLRGVGGGCLAPLGALGEVRDGRLRLRAAYDVEGRGIVRVDLEGDVGAAADVVVEAARRLLGAVVAT